LLLVCFRYHHAHTADAHRTRTASRVSELAGALKDFGGAMGELGKSSDGDAAAALGLLAACCADLATSSAAKAAALNASVDAPMRDLVRCAMHVCARAAREHRAKG
jgi:hypothetical protein